MSAERCSLKPPSRILMGPGPSDIPPRVLNAMALPTIGHLDPEFIKIMDALQQMLRELFLTENQLTIPISATGSAGMEACLVNLIEPGDRCVVCVNGVFGERMSDIVGRCGGELVRVEAEWGKTIDPADVKAALAGGKTKLVAIVHAETSTGVLQPLEEISRLTHEHDALFVVDTVTSLGGHPVRVDEWGIDACYSGTQKCLSCPPGLAPVTFGERAIAAIKARRSKVQSWYLDLTMLMDYWGESRKYHHTAPINMVYGLYEALRIIHEEGLEARWARHEANHNLLVEGLAELGLSLWPAPEDSLWTLNAVRIPDGVEDAPVRKALLEQYGIEIGGGLGPMAGQVWRVGLMGHASTRRNVALFLAALRGIL